jgi:hypothetical protein
MLALMFFQYMAGMVTNLFVQIPDSLSTQYKHGGAFYRYWGMALHWILTRSSFFLILHVILGTLLIIGAILLVCMSIAKRSRSWIIFSILGAFFMIGAWINGMFFVSFGQHNVNSLIMAIAFLAAFVCYVAGLFVER